MPSNRRPRRHTRRTTHTAIPTRYANWNDAKQKFENIEIGASVPILYLPDNPERVETVYSIENAPGGLIGTILLIIFGVLVVGLGLFGAYVVMFAGPAP